MADSVLFEVDASQILAKLHLAGLNSIKKKNDEFIVNTGILNDNQKASPENPGKVSFDLTNQSSEYEVGYVMQIEYRKSYGLEDAIDLISDLLAKTSGDKSKILDTIKNNKDDYAKFTAAREKVIDIFKAYGQDVPERINSVDEIKKLRDTAKQIIARDSTDYDAIVSKSKEYAVEKISAYLKTFAGADNVDAIDSTKLLMLDISNDVKDSNDKRLVVMYEIQAISDQDKGKMVSQFRANFEKDPKQKNCTQKVCFKVKYTLNVDK